MEEGCRELWGRALGNIPEDEHEKLKGKQNEERKKAGYRRENKRCVSGEMNRIKSRTALKAMLRT